MNIGQLYGNMLNGVKHKLLAEGKVGPKPGEIGELPLIKGGPQTTSGYMPVKVDRRTMSAKDLDKNLYNIKDLSEEDEEEPKKSKKSKLRFKKKDPKAKNKNPFAKTKETKEEAEECRKMVKESINNFMRRKSIFDKLYENVMSPGGAPSPDMGGEMDQSEELDALGIDGEEGMDEEGGGDVTLTLDRATAEQLMSMLSSALEGGMEDEGLDDMDFEDEGGMGDEGDMGNEEDEESFWDEDEEDLGTPISGAKQVNMGKNNKVGNLKVQSGGASSAYTSKVGPDGDHGHALVNGKQPNMGKNNKVSSLKTGKSLFEQ
jgi:hypothetical protein